MMTTFRAAFQQQVFFVDTDGYLDMRDADFALLAARLNPGVPWWAGQERE